MKTNIDSDNFVHFDLKAIKGTFLELQVNETIQFCKMALMTNTFERGDYKELLELTLLYLCPDVKYTIKAPGGMSHARFMSKAIYYLKIAILSAQLPFGLSPCD